METNADDREGVLTAEEVSMASTEEEIQAKAKAEKVRKEILNRAVSGNINSLRDKVAFILNNSLDARNSDVDLAWEYWATFESQKFNGNSITREQMMRLTRISSMSRVRAKIQNEYKLFEADAEVKRYRRIRQADNKNQAVADKPSGIGVYNVYVDETGKTQNYLSVGSLWISEGGGGLAILELQKWKKDNRINYEFHFNEVNKKSVHYFKEFFTKFRSLHPAAGFKIIVVKNSGFSDLNTAITDLTFHILDKGIDHEDTSGRATLPRMLQVYIDDEEVGSDTLKLENVKERISSQKIDGLHIGEFEAVSSSGNFYIQIVDLFTGAVNRKLHYPDGTHFKDEFANYILDSLGFEISDVDTRNSSIDHSKVFNLGK